MAESLIGNNKDDLDAMSSAIGSTVGTPLFDEIGAALQKELWRRLKDPKLVKELPGNQLMRLSSDYLKLRPKDKPEGERNAQTELQTIFHADIPANRKIELLLNRRENLDTEIQGIDIIVKGLRDGTI